MAANTLFNAMQKYTIKSDLNTQFVSSTDITVHENQHNIQPPKQTCICSDEKQPVTAQTLFNDFNAVLNLQQLHVCHKISLKNKIRSVPCQHS